MYVSSMKTHSDSTRVQRRGNVGGLIVLVVLFVVVQRYLFLEKTLNVQQRWPVNLVTVLKMKVIVVLEQTIPY